MKTSNIEKFGGFLFLFCNKWSRIPTGEGLAQVPLPCRERLLNLYLHFGDSTNKWLHCTDCQLLLFSWMLYLFEAEDVFRNLPSVNRAVGLQTLGCTVFPRSVKLCLLESPQSVSQCKTNALTVSFSTSSDRADGQKWMNSIKKTVKWQII